jgi:DNA-directed RNA polymerase subunit RPC12/RpoP
MVLYKCDRCKKEFTRKQTYDGHINRKHKCIEKDKSVQESPIVSSHSPAVVQESPTIVQVKSESGLIEKTTKRPVCNICGKEFNNPSNLSRHKKGRCKGSATPVIEVDKMTELLAKMNEMEAELSKLKSEGATPKNTISGDVVIGNKSGDTTTNNTINIMAFGSNDWESFVTEEECKRILRTGFKAVPNLVDHIHLNKELPALQNCYIANFRGKHAMTHDGSSWKLVDMGDVIEKLREDKQDYLALKFDEYRKSLDDVTIKRFDKFLDEKDTDVVINQQKEDIKLLLYNNSSKSRKANNKGRSH